MPESSNIRDLVEATTELSKALPVYQDLVQPTAQVLGTEVGRTVKAFLAPLRAMVWGIEKIEDFVAGKVLARLKDTPPEEIVSPAPNIAVPVLEALRYTGCIEELANLYASLLATAMTKKVAGQAHPAFVEIVRQLSAAEAKLMKYLANQEFLPVISITRECTSTKGQKTYLQLLPSYSHFGRNSKCGRDLDVPMYLDNLSRLGLIVVTSDGYANPILYKGLEEDAWVKRLLETLPDPQPGTRVSLKVARRTVAVTDFGVEFAKACGIGSGVQIVPDMQAPTLEGVPAVYS